MAGRPFGGPRHGVGHDRSLEELSKVQVVDRACAPCQLGVGESCQALVAAAQCSSFGDALGVEPGLDVGRVESDELADLEERDASLSDEAADEAISDAEPVSELLDAEQRGTGRVDLGGLSRRHGADRAKPTSSATYRFTSLATSHSQEISGR